MTTKEPQTSIAARIAAMSDPELLARAFLAPRGVPFRMAMTLPLRDAARLALALACVPDELLVALKMLKETKELEL